MKNWIKALVSSDSQESLTHTTPNLVSHYWDGESAPPAAHHVRDINARGMYLLTERRWYPETLLTVTLQMIGSSDSENVISVLAKVVHFGPDGVGFKFVFPSESKDAEYIHNRIAGKRTLGRFLRRLNKSLESEDRKPDGVVEKTPRLETSASSNLASNQQQRIAEAQQDKAAEELRRKAEEERQRVAAEEQRRKAEEERRRFAAELAAEEGQRIAVETLGQLAVEEKQRLVAWLAAEERAAATIGKRAR